MSLNVRDANLFCKHTTQRPVTEVVWPFVQFIPYTSWPGFVYFLKHPMKFKQQHVSILHNQPILALKNVIMIRALQICARVCFSFVRLEGDHCMTPKLHFYILGNIEILVSVCRVKMAPVVPLARRLIARLFEACYHPVGPRPHRCTGDVATLTSILSQKQYCSL